VCVGTDSSCRVQIGSTKSTVHRESHIESYTHSPPLKEPKPTPTRYRYSIKNFFFTTPAGTCRPLVALRLSTVQRREEREYAHRKGISWMHTDIYTRVHRPHTCTCHTHTHTHTHRRRKTNHHPSHSSTVADTQHTTQTHTPTQQGIIGEKDERRTHESNTRGARPHTSFGSAFTGALGFCAGLIALPGARDVTPGMNGMPVGGVFVRGELRKNINCERSYAIRVPGEGERER
jgi:hypothetical protein